MLIFLLHIHDVWFLHQYTKSMCDPTTSNEDPFVACGKVAQSQRAAVHLLGSKEKNVLYSTFSHFGVTEFQL